MPYQTPNWVFTINNPTPFDRPRQWPGVKFGVYQMEKGEEGTPHLQGYIILNKKATLAGVKKLHATAHWEPRKGSHDQAVAYCTKEETRVSESETWGEAPSGQGHRSDLAAVQASLDSGASDEEVATEFFATWVKYHRSFDAYRLLKQAPRDPEHPVTTYAFVGPSGTGKTRLARLLAGDDAFWLTAPNSTANSLWWDGYHGQATIVIDEFYGWIPHPVMLRICDRYPLTVQVKGGSRHLLATTVIITSNKHPDDWWPRTGLGAMKRRLTAPSGGCFVMNAEPANYEDYVQSLELPSDLPPPFPLFH